MQWAGWGQEKGHQNLTPGQFSTMRQTLISRIDQCSPPCVADVFHKPSSQLGHSCPNHRPREKMMRSRRKAAQGGQAGRAAYLAKVRQAEAAGSVGTVREGMCEMLQDDVSCYIQTA